NADIASRVAAGTRPTGLDKIERDSRAGCRCGPLRRPGPIGQREEVDKRITVFLLNLVGDQGVQLPQGRASWHTINTGHYPMLSAPDAVVGILLSEPLSHPSPLRVD